MTQNKSSIPVFILAGGLGTRISEETALKPKPMIEIGETPVLVHLMRWYYAHGFNDFVICAGYKSWEIKAYFLNYQFRQNHVAIDHRGADRAATWFGHNLAQERWRVRVVDTGVDCMTGARLARAYDELYGTGQESVSNFALTYGDGLCDVDVATECDWHLGHGKLGSVLAVRPSARFGELEIESDDTVGSFVEKPLSKQGFINGGFFFFRSEFRKYLSTDSTCVLEKEPLSALAEAGELRAYRHERFWQPMDTLRDKTLLEKLWDSGRPPWVKRP